MNSSVWRKGTAAGLLLIGALCSAQAQEPRMDDKVADVSLLLKLLQLNRPEIALLAGKNCKADEEVCVIEMTLIEVEVDKPKYCLALAPTVEVKRKTLSDPKKPVVWMLSRYDLDKKPLAFHVDPGIVITYDPKGQISKGGSGAGPIVGIQDPKLHHVKTTRDKYKAESNYLPIILWGDSGNEDLCAATDPKIVNVE